jgi:hypothetical protein
VLRAERARGSKLKSLTVREAELLRVGRKLHIDIKQGRNVASSFRNGYNTQNIFISAWCLIQ